MHPNRKQYRLLNLTSGDKVIGELVMSSKNSITLYRPFQIKILTIMDPIDDDPNNMIRQEVCVLRNWLDLSKSQKAEIENVHILSTTEPVEKVCDFYDAEKEKEDNPIPFDKILENLKKAHEELEDLEDIEDQEEDDELRLYFNPNDIKNIVSQIITADLNRSHEEPEPEPEDEDDIEDDSKEECSTDEGDSEDTDKEMFGW